jgi:hypothetical protein
MLALTFLFLVLYVASEQRRNLRILYDALGTLADAVGAELNQVLTSSQILHCFFCISCKTILVLSEFRLLGAMISCMPIPCEDTNSSKLLCRQNI